MTDYLPSSKNRNIASLEISTTRLHSILARKKSTCVPPRINEDRRNDEIFLDLSDVLSEGRGYGLDRKSQLSIIGGTIQKALKEESNWN
jgi:hypothetical protein